MCGNKSRPVQNANTGSRPVIRRIREADNPAVAEIIRTVMTEFGAVGCGFSIEDPEVGNMSDAYADERSGFFVIEAGGRVLGCGGIGPLHGGDRSTCELRKMYFLPELRGMGMGAAILARCLDTARTLGYKRCYLETLESMSAARRLYRKFGFKSLDRPLGSTGHTGCNQWMSRTL